MNTLLLSMNNLASVDWADVGTSVLIFAAGSVSFFLLGKLLLSRPGRSRDASPANPFDDSDNDRLLDALAAQIPESKKERHDFQLLLRQAGIYHPRARTTIYALRFVLLFVPLVATGVFAVLAETERTVPILVIGGLTAAGLSIVPRLYVFFRRRARLQRIRSAMPDVLDMLSMCSGGGLGLGESLEHVSSQLVGCPEMTQELEILRRQAEMGSLRSALADFARRVDLSEARQLAGLLTRGAHLGTQLAGSLNDQADHLRMSRRQTATARANKLPVKLVFPILFCFAPAALILLTAPAMLELHDFLRPRATSDAAPGDGFGTGAVVRTMDRLDQSLDPGAPVRR
ncbi:MAG: type II secretion system F family protein [Pirellulales bacterium]|nr:type II secretion system F family protein [Pirellulales bacterium]